MGGGEDMSREYINNLFRCTPSGAEVCDNSDNHYDCGEPVPFTTVPVYNCAIPEECKRQEDEPENGNEDSIEYAFKPIGEEPEEKNDQARCEETDDS